MSRGRRRVQLFIGRQGHLVTVALVAVAMLMTFAIPTAAMTVGARSLDGAQANRDVELVYLDADGVIKVFDPLSAEGEPAVEWESPGGGWLQFALGDFNADGDTEIVAIRSDGGNRLAIFDPVAEGLGPGEADGQFNGIPWKLLYDQPLTGPPLILAAGEFDLASPADEIVYYYTMPAEEIVFPDDPYRFVFLSAQGEPVDGSEWSTVLTHDSGNAWNKIIPGNYDGIGADEVALIFTELGNLSVYRIVDGRLDRIRRDSNKEKEWQDGDAGQYIAGGQEELAVGREADLNHETLFVTYFVDEDVWPDHLAEYNDPPPRVVFMGDLNGSGDDEVVVLRQVPPEQAGRPRLFVRNFGGDPIGLGERPLDADNGYRAGVAGDIDGDGRDEVAIMRDNRIRIFTEPEASASFTDEEVDTGARLILAGNLDANGLSGESRFGASPSSLEDNVVSGTTSEPHVVALSDVVNGRSIPFTYRVEGDATWVGVSRSRDSTPSTLTIVLDARDLEPDTYTDRLIIEAVDGSVVNTPFAIDVSMTVQPGIVFSPAEIVAVDYDCGDGAAALSYPIEIQGTSGAAYTLTVQSPVPWATISPPTGTIPTTATLLLDGVELGSGLGTTVLAARATIAGEQAVARAPVSLYCAENVVHLPAIAR